MRGNRYETSTNAVCSKYFHTMIVLDTHSLLLAHTPMSARGSGCTAGGTSVLQQGRLAAAKRRCVE